MSNMIAQHAATAINALCKMQGNTIYLETQQGQVEITGVYHRRESTIDAGGSTQSTVWAVTTTADQIPATAQRLAGMTVAVNGTRQAITRAHESSGGVLVIEMGRV